MHPLVVRCLAGSDADAISTLRLFVPGQPPTEECLDLADQFLDRGMFEPAETVFWKILCLPGSEFPASIHRKRIYSRMSRFPADYGVGRRVAEASGLLADLPDPLSILFRSDPGSVRSLLTSDWTNPLIRVASCKSLYPKDSPGQGQAPIHALRLLGELEAAEAVGPLLRGLEDPEIFDYAFQDLAWALGRLGPPALESILVALQAPDLDEFQIITLLRILRDLAIVHDSCRAPVGAFLIQIGRHAQPPPEVRAFALRYLIEVGARDYFEVIEDLLEEEFLNRAVALSADRLRQELNEARQNPPKREDRRREILSRFSLLYPVQ